MRTQEKKIEYISHLQEKSKSVSPISKDPILCSVGRVHVILGGEMEVYVSARQEEGGKQSLTKRAVVSLVSSPWRL